MAKTNSTSDLFASFAPPKLKESPKRNKKETEATSKEAKAPKTVAVDKEKEKTVKKDTIKEEIIKEETAPVSQESEDVSIPEKTVATSNDYSDYERMAPKVGRPRRYDLPFKVVTVRLREDLLVAADSKKDKFGSRNEYINYLIAKDNNLLN